MNHNQAIELERIVRSVYDCDRAGMGGYIDADNFSSNPFDAALIALAPLWKNDSDRQVENFCINGTTLFEQRSRHRMIRLSPTLSSWSG